jgi:Tfp pilus assembly protein PilO
MKTKNKKLFMTIAIIWAVSFVLFVLAYVVLILPQQKSKEQVESEYAQIKRKYDSVIEMRKEETRARLKEELESLKNQLKDFALDSENAPNLTFDISQIANKKKVDSFSIKTQENVKTSAGLGLKHIKENEIDINFAGDFNQFATFLNTLERNRPVVFVDSFKITRSHRDELGHKVNMKLAVFIRKQQDS